MDLSLSVAIIAVLFCLNTIFVVITLIKIIKTVGEAQKLIEMTRLHIAPISHDIAQITGDVRSIVKSVEKQVDKIEDSVTHVRDIARNIKEFEAMIQDRVERPILEVTAVLSAIIKGGQVFWRRFIKK